MLKRNVFLLKFTIFFIFGSFPLNSRVEASTISSFESISDQCCSDFTLQDNATDETQLDRNVPSLERPELLEDKSTNKSLKTNRASGNTTNDTLDLSSKTDNASEQEGANQRVNAIDKNHFTLSHSNSNDSDSQKSYNYSPVNNTPSSYIDTSNAELNPSTTVKNEDLTHETATNSEASSQTALSSESPEVDNPNQHSFLQYEIIKTNTNPSITISSHSESSNYTFEIVLLNSSKQAEGSHLNEEQRNYLKNYYLLETNYISNSSIEIRDDDVYKEIKEHADSKVNESSESYSSSKQFNPLSFSDSTSPAVQNWFKKLSKDDAFKKESFLSIHGLNGTELLNNNLKYLTEASETSPDPSISETSSEFSVYESSSESHSTSTEPQKITSTTTLNHLTDQESSLNTTDTHGPAENVNNRSSDLYNSEDDNIIFSTIQENDNNSERCNKTCSSPTISENSEAISGSLSSSFEIFIKSTDTAFFKNVTDRTVENRPRNNEENQTINYNLKAVNKTVTTISTREFHNSKTSYHNLYSSSETDSESTPAVVDRIPSVLLAEENNHPVSNHIATSKKQHSARNTSSNDPYLEKSLFESPSSQSLENKTLLSTNDFRLVPNESSTLTDSLILTTNIVLNKSSRNDKKLSQNFTDLWNNSIWNSHRIESNSKLSKDFLYYWGNSSSDSTLNKTNVSSTATPPPIDNKEGGKIFWNPLTNILHSSEPPPIEEPTTEGRIFWNLCFTRKPGLLKNPKEIMMTSGPTNTKVFWNLCPTKKPYLTTQSYRPTETAVHYSTSTTPSPPNSFDVPSSSDWSNSSSNEVASQTNQLAEEPTTTQITEATDVTDTEAATEETTQTLEEQKEYLFPVYWNVPTFQCHKYGLNFSRVKEWGLRQNYQDEFRGEEIAILYDPGEFPALLPASAGRRVQRNGGVPQEGSLTRHLSLFQGHLEKLIPDANFSGLAIIDFEHWRPVWRQNWGSLSPYRDFSRLIEKRRHPFWFSTMVEVEATYRYELGARVFLLDTLRLGKKLRPRAKWGYYGFPFCFNYTPYNNRAACSYEVQLDNDNMYWLFSETTAHYPSLYLKYNDMYSTKRQRFIKGRLDEALRVAEGVPVYPYVWYKYHDTHQFITKGDMVNLLKIPKDYGCKGVVIWGASRDVNSRQKCIALQSYLDEVIGPAVRDLQEDTFRKGDVDQEEEENSEEDFDEDEMDFNEKKTGYDIRDFEV